MHGELLRCLRGHYPLRFSGWALIVNPIARAIWELRLIPIPNLNKILKLKIENSKKEENKRSKRKFKNKTQIFYQGQINPKSIDTVV